MIAKKNTTLVVRRSMGGAVKAKCFTENKKQCSSFVTMKAFPNHLCKKTRLFGEPVVGFSVDMLGFGWCE